MANASQDAQASNDYGRLVIDRKFLEQFNAMTSGWNYEDETGKEVLRLLLHLFSRISITKRERHDGSSEWMLTVVGRDETCG